MFNIMLVGFLSRIFVSLWSIVRYICRRISLPLLISSEFEFEVNLNLFKRNVARFVIARFIITKFIIVPIGYFDHFTISYLPDHLYSLLSFLKFLSWFVEL